MNKRIALALVLALAVGSTGCAGFKLPGTQGDQIVTFAGVTAVGCGFIPEKDKANARKAVACAKAVFSETLAADQVAACAAAGGVPSQYQVLVGLVIEQVKKATGGGAILDQASPEAKAINEFLRVCGAALVQV